MSIGATIRRIRKQKRMTLEQVSAASGTDTGNLSRLERDMQGYTDESLRAIAGALGVRVSDFFIEDTAKAGDAVVDVIRRAAPSSVPLLTWDQAGGPQATSDERIATQRPIPDGFALEVTTDAMCAANGDNFPIGSIIVLARRPPRAGDYVVARRSSRHEPIFRQWVEDGGARHLKPLNPRYPILEMDSTGAVLGVVVEASWSRVFP